MSAGEHVLRNAELGGDLGARRGASELGFETGSGLAGLHGAGRRHAREAGWCGTCWRCRAGSPGGSTRSIGRELEALAPVELVDGAEQPEVPLLHEVEELEPGRPVALGDRDDEAQVRLDERVTRRISVACRADQLTARCRRRTVAGAELLDALRSRLRCAAPGRSRRVWSGEGDGRCRRGTARPGPGRRTLPRV